MGYALSRTIAAWASLTVFATPQLFFPPQTAASDKPVLAVFLEKSEVREDDSVRVHFQVTNDGPAKITSAKITIISPGNFLEWFCGGCSPKGESLSEVDLGAIEASHDVEREVWFHTRPNIPIGQFNLLFLLGTESDAKPPRKSVVTVEKTLTVKLLGTDTLGGIPLALAWLIVPGLFFWLALYCFGVNKAIGLALGDKIIFSMLASVLLLFVSTLFHVAEISSGLSIRKLLIWALLGTVTGVVWGGGDRIRRCTKSKREKEITIEPLDDEQTVFRKLLARYWDKEKPLCKVILKDNKEYYGSLVYQDSGKTWLVGWYQVKQSELDAIGNQDARTLSKEILRHRTALERREGILEFNDGVYEDTLKWLLPRNNAEVLRVEMLTSGWKVKPLELV